LIFDFYEIDPFHSRCFAGFAFCISGFAAACGAGGEIRTHQNRTDHRPERDVHPEEGVFKVSAPRSTCESMWMPGNCRRSWGDLLGRHFYSRKRREAMVMGDLVLFRTRSYQVMSAALENGLSVTALHNHFFFDAAEVYSCTSG